LVKFINTALELIMAQQLQELICTREALKHVPFLVQKIQLKKQLTSAIVFVFEGQVYAYVNHCMHMQRPLNCEEDAIFDETGKYLRCSMHGFIFDPKTGECQSPVCFGQRLQALRIKEIEGMVYFAEKQLQCLTEK